MSKFKRHFFVCNMDRPPFMKPSCGPRGGKEILDKFLEALANHPELWNDVNVTPAGCFGGLCFDGPALVVYPDAIWYARLTPADADEVIQSHLVGGQPVERLFYQWPAP